ncbi:MAG TPA: transglutaminase-like domain-containing protein [Luteitalea sp.]|nr:transglutaminase-like domain-containing protein [Luteitalea sp.]
MTAAEREAFIAVAQRPGEDDLAEAALLLARLDYPAARLDEARAQLETLADRAGAFVQASSAPGDVLGHVQHLGQHLFDTENFSGNLSDYEDTRNSFLNDVLARRTGIPITLSIIYMHVGRRVGLWLEGVNFPGHFLVRCKGMLGDATPTEDLILDPFHGGIVLTERDCARLLAKHSGEAARFDRALLAPAFKTQVLVRVLLNLKRAYARMRLFSRARDVSDLVLTLDPTSFTEVRDRGLLSYQLGHFNAALADLEHYLALTARHTRRDDEDADVKEEFEAVWEHVKNLRRRVASLN